MNKPNRTFSQLTVTRRTFARTLGVAAIGTALPIRTLFATALRDNDLQEVHHSTFVMGQIANITIYHPDSAHARHAITAVFQEFRRLEGLLSVYDPASELSAINRNAGKRAVPVSAETLEIIANSVALAGETNGALDITVEPLERLWGFRGGERVAPPTDKEVATTLEAVGVGNIRIEGKSVGLLKQGGALDLGGVAVGYALDRGAEILRREGIARALLELSGDFYAIDAPPEQTGWEIGILDPRIDEGILETVRIADTGLSTSGNYANTVTYRAKTYGHIFDCTDGYPAERLLSATVIAPSAFHADTYSTALFVGGNSTILPPDSRSILLPP